MPTLGRFDANDPAPRATTQFRAPRIPSIKIDHKRGQFTVGVGDRNEPVDALIGDELTVVGLGLIRSRQMWGEVLGRRAILCKSHDTIIGKPSMENFPWDESNFANVLSNSTLPCSDCGFKAPAPRDEFRCTETWTVPVIGLPRSSTNVQISGGGLTHYTLISDPNTVYTIGFTASSIRNLTEYLTPFRDKRPLYDVWTRIKLRKVSSNDSVYTVASFETHSETDPEDRPKYAKHLADVKALFQPPAPVEFKPLRKPGA